MKINRKSPRWRLFLFCELDWENVYYYSFVLGNVVWHIEEHYAIGIFPHISPIVT